MTLDDLIFEVRTTTDGPAIVAPCDQYGHPTRFTIDADLHVIAALNLENPGANLQVYLDGVLTERLFKEVSLQGDVGHVSFSVEIQPPLYAALRSGHLLELKVFNQFLSVSRFWALTYLQHEGDDK